MTFIVCSTVSLPQDVRDLLSTKRRLESEVAAGKLEVAELAEEMAADKEARLELEQTAEAFAANSEELDIAVRDAEAREQAVSTCVQWWRAILRLLAYN